MLKRVSFSVVIPLYEKEDVIWRALNSVIPQLRADDEVIVVDDGSNDGGAALLEGGICDAIPVRVIRQKNQGVSVARNKGVHSALHDHIVLLDADDWWLDGMPDKLEELINRWPGAEAWSVGHYRVDGTTSLRINSGLGRDSLLEGAGFVRHYGKFSGTINSSTACIRKSAFVDSGGFPPGVTSGEDVYLWLTLGLRGGIGVSPKPLVCIERPLSGKYDNKGRDVVGFHYRYFGNRKNLDRLEKNERLSIKSFLVRNGLRQVAGSAAVGDYSAAWRRTKVISSVVRWFPLLGIVTMIMPRWVLGWAFRRRHRLSR